MSDVTLYLEQRSKIFFLFSVTVDVSHTMLAYIDTVPHTAVVVSVDV